MFSFGFCFRGHVIDLVFSGSFSRVSLAFEGTSDSPAWLFSPAPKKNTTTTSTPDCDYANTKPFPKPFPLRFVGWGGKKEERHAELNWSP